MQQSVNITYDSRTFECKVCDHIADCDDSWIKCQPDDNVYLQFPFLSAIEESPPDEMQFRYVSVFEDSKPIGVIYFQSKLFRTYDSLNYKHDQVAAITARWKKSIARLISFNGSVCGNTLLTGDNGFFLRLESPREKQLELVVQILNWVRAHTYSRKTRPHFVLYKDFYQHYGDHIGQGKSGIHAFSVQPNMILNFDPNWHSFDDYLDSMHSKYRKRLRKAKKRSEALELQVVELDNSPEFYERIHKLYEKVELNASFNLFELSPAYWRSMQEHLGAKFHVYSIVDGEKIIGFFTAIVKNDEIDAHFLGYEYDLVKTYDLYLNMLIKLVELGFELGKRKVVFSRTAMEIKSSVGAVPIEMYCYFQHDYRIGRFLFNRMLPFLNPTNNWNQRHPFK